MKSRSIAVALATALLASAVPATALTPSAFYIFGDSFTDAGNTAFQRLFRYISGNNVAQQKIAMTAPVTQVGAGDGYRVAFSLPASYTLETAPVPLDRTIEVRAVPAQLVATWRYSGRWTESNYREHEAALRAAIAARNLKVTGEPVLARYNPPFTPWFLRRNEIWLALEADPPGAAGR